jgi:hypothetical protein
VPVTGYITILDRGLRAPLNGSVARKLVAAEPGRRARNQPLPAPAGEVRQTFALRAP